MEELNIQIEVIECEMQALENRVDDCTRYGRQCDKKERFNQIAMLAEWRDYNNRLMALKELRDTIESNASQA